MRRLNGLDWVAMVLLIIGGINWGLIGFFDYNLVSAIFGSGTVARVIYSLVGLSALYAIYTLYKANQGMQTTGTRETETDMRTRRSA